MVYDSDFSRRQFLNSCNESGVFYSAPDYKPQGYLSTLRAPSTPSPTSTRSERTAKLLASLSINNPPPRFDNASSFPQPFDPAHPYTSSSATGPSINSGQEEPYGYQQTRLPISVGQQRTSCCACCRNCNAAGSTSRFGPTPLEPTSPFGGSHLGTQDGMESYIRSRRPLDYDQSMQVKSKSPYSVRSIPVRSLEELRETVAIRRDYIKQRHQLQNDSSLLLPQLRSKENSVSPQPDGSIVTYPSESNGDGTEEQLKADRSGGSYYETSEN